MYIHTCASRAGPLQYIPGPLLFQALSLFVRCFNLLRRRDGSVSDFASSRMKKNETAETAFVRGLHYGSAQRAEEHLERGS